jgi:signal transduction histidine kinase
MQLYIEEHINVEFDFPQEPLKLSVPTDRKWLDFILRQILRNAIKYKKEDVVFIRFMAKPLPQGVQLCVEDQGIGIPEHDLDRIFEKGYTGTNGRDTTTGDRVKSTGIGLYLCRKLCNKLGITITARSKVGEYTRIYLQFPNSDYHQRVT